MAKISDFELLKLLQSELVEILIERKNTEKWFARSCCKAKIHRLRLQIQEVMLRIENKCDTYYKKGKEEWE